MRLSVLTLLLGCGNTANAPETTINPNPAPAVILTAREDDEPQYLPEILHLSYEAPTPSVENGIAIYDLNPIIDKAGCVEGAANYSLHFAPDATVVPFYCNSDAFVWHNYDLPLVNNVTEHHFIFGKMDGTETIYEPLADSKIVTECEGYELGLVFWSTHEGLNTLCSDEEVIDRGFQDVFFSNRSARIVLKGPL